MLILLGILCSGILLGYLLGRHFFQKEKTALLHLLEEKLSAKDNEHLLRMEEAERFASERLRAKESEKGLLVDSYQKSEGYWKERISELEISLERLGQKQAEVQDENASLQNQLTEMQTRLLEERKQTSEKLALLQESKEQMKQEFGALAQKIFEEKGKTFATQNQEKLDLILKPFKEQIGEFKKKVEDSYTTEAKERHSLSEEVKKLKELNLRISQDAINLTKALKGESKIRGNWGEVVLERILEESGLREGIEYETQQHLQSTEGGRYHPDVIVRLPDGKDVVIDSKVSLVAYEQYASAEDEEEKRRQIGNHLLSIRTHIRQLSEKNYQNLEKIRTLDFVLLFMPIEGAFLLAAENDSKLFTDALEKNIMIVSPNTLLVTLRTIQNIWRYEYQNKNAEEIARRAGDMYDKFVGFVDDVEKIGTQITRLQDTHEKAYRKLTLGPGNLVNRANALLELGLKAKKKLKENGTETDADRLPEGKEPEQNLS